MPSKRKQYSAEYRSPAFPGNLVGHLHDGSRTGQEMDRAHVPQLVRRGPCRFGSCLPCQRQGDGIDSGAVGPEDEDAVGELRNSPNRIAAHCGVHPFAFARETVDKVDARRRKEACVYRVGVRVPHVQMERPAPGRPPGGR